MVVKLHNRTAPVEYETGLMCMFSFRVPSSRIVWPWREGLQLPFPWATTPERGWPWPSWRWRTSTALCSPSTRSERWGMSEGVLQQCRTQPALFFSLPQIIRDPPTQNASAVIYRQTWQTGIDNLLGTGPKNLAIIICLNYNAPFNFQSSLLLIV